MLANRSSGSWVTDDELVTGEAVALDLPPASIGPRLVSGAIDLIIGYAVLFGLFVVIGSTLFVAEIDAALAAAISLLVTLVALLGVPVAFETLSKGRTPGKFVMGLRTVRDDAGPITFRHALARGLVGVVEIYMFQGVPAVLSAMITGKGKRIGDIAAGTYVIRERVSAVLPPPIPMPPPLRAWAEQADIRALPDGLCATVRSFLTTAHQLTPAARDQIGRQLHADVMTYVAPAPPAGAPVEAVLAAVIADRRRRDLIRLARDASLRQRILPPA